MVQIFIVSSNYAVLTCIVLVTMVILCSKGCWYDYIMIVSRKLQLMSLRQLIYAPIAVHTYNPLPTIGNSLKKQKSLYKVLTPSIKPPYILLRAYGSS